MDNLGGLIVLVVIWIIGSLFEQKKRQERRTRQRTAPPPPPSSEPLGDERELASSRREVGSKLEEVLRQIDPALADAMSTGRKTEEEPVTEPEPTPQVMSLETGLDDLEARRAARPTVDRAREAAEVGRRRLSAAAERNRPRRPSDHDAFHEAIRAPADATEVVVRRRRYDIAALQQAIVWREIIGPPKGLED